MDTMRIRMDEGTEMVCKTGGVVRVPSGHDAWVEGNEPVVVVDFRSMVDYARSSVRGPSGPSWLPQTLHPASDQSARGGAGGGE